MQWCTTYSTGDMAVLPLSNAIIHRAFGTRPSVFCTLGKHVKAVSVGFLIGMGPVTKDWEYFPDSVAQVFHHFMWHKTLVESVYIAVAHLEY